ncbi:MAG: TPM domain-containing protein [Clostridia bacterium]|nr:TPM domain-containing protein [Clostridia bacterium]
MKKSLWILLCACLLTVSAFAVDHGYVYDGADLYTEDEEAKIIAAAETVYTESGLLCVIVTDYGIGGMLNMLPTYAGSAVDMALLTIDMSARQFDLYQYNAVEGESAFRISSSETDTILDGILSDMADGNYADAALSFLELAEESFTNAEAFDPANPGNDYEYKGYYTPEYQAPHYDRPYVTEYQPHFSISTVLVPLFVGLLAGGITVLCVRGSYKKKVHGATYPLGQYTKLDLIDAKDTFITKNVVVTRIPDDPPAHHGGSRGGGFHGGGGSRGGGGAHMGGRSF